MAVKVLLDLVAQDLPGVTFISSSCGRWRNQLENQ
jgi:hypothetical protein